MRYGASSLSHRAVARELAAPDNERRLPRAEYTPQAVEACEKALRTLLTRIGPWGTQLVLIGGMAPRYLVGCMPAALPPHVGTTDLDVVVGVALETNEEEAYRTLQKNLIECGFTSPQCPVLRLHDESCPLAPRASSLPQCQGFFPAGLLSRA